jgi:hypothetical protein
VNEIGARRGSSRSRRRKYSGDSGVVGGGMLRLGLEVSWINRSTM